MKTVSPEALVTNPFADIGGRWMLISAARDGKFNTMTASWGGFGVFWNKPSVIAVVRPTRHTYEFMEKTDTFTLSFLPERHRAALNYCGSHSGREVDKIKATGLTPVWDNADVWFEEADMVLRCRKLYVQDLNPAGFTEAELDSRWYPEKDYHRFYIAEIITAMQARDETD